MICFVRHTQVNVTKGICYGQTNVGLADSFLEEAAKVKKQLNRFTFDTVYSSPLDRCVKLAEFCGYPKAIPSAALMELNFGDWENKAWNDLDMTIWKTDWVNNPPPHGESFMEMYQRVSQFLSKLPKENILIFTHKGVINCAKSYFKNIPLTATFDDPLDYGEIVIF